MRRKTKLHHKDEIKIDDLKLDELDVLNLILSCIKNYVIYGDIGYARNAVSILEKLLEDKANNKTCSNQSDPKITLN